ncbi:hypothetical protein SUGI_0251420 [Cryptomeria japonica]|nr:hypothetical protein SUGI_0251420 [Cryptomeria japonica]
MGGLGIRKINALNKALIAKIGWTLAKGEVDWCNIIREKYLDREQFYYNLSTVDLPQGSKLWNSILKIKLIVREGLKWQLGNGRKVIFWEDVWADDIPLSNTHFHQIMHHLKGLLGDCIADYMEPGRGGWRNIVQVFSNKPNVVPIAQDLQNIMMETRIPLASHEDKFI